MVDIEKVKNTRIALQNEIDRGNSLVGAFKLQEAEDQFKIIHTLYGDLAKVVSPNSDVHQRILQNMKSRMTTLSQKIENGLAKKEAGKKEDGNIAFKCNWNDRNYKGICSEKAYKYNQIWGGPWCYHSKCRQYVNLPTPPDNCCYESRALIDCNFGAGWDHDEINGAPIRPRAIRSAKKGKFAILTTIRPNTDDRVIVGLFQISKIAEDPGQETFIYGDKGTMLNDMLNYEIMFWNHHENPNNPSSKAWATGLFRYVSDLAIFGVLTEYIEKKGQRHEDISKAKVLLQSLVNISK